MSTSSNNALPTVAEVNAMIPGEWLLLGQANMPRDIDQEQIVDLSILSFEVSTEDLNKFNTRKSFEYSIDINGVTSQFVEGVRFTLGVTYNICSGIFYDNKIPIKGIPIIPINKVVILASILMQNDVNNPLQIIITNSISCNGLVVIPQSLANSSVICLRVRNI